MNVLKYINAVFPSFFISFLILHHSFIDILSFKKMEQNYDHVEVLKSSSHNQKQTFCDASLQ